MIINFRVFSSVAKSDLRFILLDKTGYNLHKTIYFILT